MFIPINPAPIQAYQLFSFWHMRSTIQLEHKFIVQPDYSVTLQVCGWQVATYRKSSTLPFSKKPSKELYIYLNLGLPLK